MAFHRINVQLTDRQMRIMMLESQATGLRIGTLIRIMLHEDIASGRALKNYRKAQRESRGDFLAQTSENGLDDVEEPV